MLGRAPLARLFAAHAADAAATCEAVARPNMRFVPLKSISQQCELLVHRARQGVVAQRTATLNRIPGLLSELGIVLPLKAIARLGNLSLVLLRRAMRSPRHRVA